MVRKSTQKATSRSVESTGQKSVKTKKAKKEPLGSLHVVHDDGKYFFTEMKGEKEVSRDELKPEMILQILVFALEEGLKQLADEWEKAKKAKKE